MANNKPNVFIINIRPENWDVCIKDHRFGIRVDARRPQFSKGDIFLVRRTGKDYGVMGVWKLIREEYVTNPEEVPWEDYEYKWQQWFDPIVDFKTPMSDEFQGTSKYSEKLQISAMRIVGSVVTLNSDEIVRYLDKLIEEKTSELDIEREYDGTRMSAVAILQIIRDLYSKEPEKAVTPPAVKKERDKPVGEPINFRGMVYAPLNEAGVVLLFSKVMDELGIIYESSPLTGFDMVGRMKTGKGYERKHFEFEYWSSNFKAHKHDPSMVDYIVCWEHDWKGCPEEIQVIELKQVIKDLPAAF